MRKDDKAKCKQKRATRGSKQDPGKIKVEMIRELIKNEYKSSPNLTPDIT